MPSLVVPSPLGALTLTSDGSSITNIDFGKHAKTMASSDKVLMKCRKELQEYFDGKRSSFSATVSPEDTAFQKKVWREMLCIPYGSTISYKELSKRAGKPNAIRAAASACGKNPIVILVPCHRITASNGGIGGYSGGVEKKRWLLRHERETQA
ncbi:methylated-DNA--[protein]-cysteine S-methyltransferase [Candidatus Peribacteria bacterium]|nr:methylated-DNA--[protein]-cysteine S-methyltransferase [Candidatus Peribacteria bacterium]